MFPCTFVQLDRVVKSDAELMLNVADVQAGLADAVVVVCAIETLVLEDASFRPMDTKIAL